jgi:hypothetical protein
MSDLVEETVRGIRARLKELAPVVGEYERLQAAYAALDGAGAGMGHQRSVGAARANGRASRPLGGERVRGRGVRMRGSSAGTTRRRCGVDPVPWTLERLGRKARAGRMSTCREPVRRICRSFAAGRLS